MKRTHSWEVTGEDLGTGRPRVSTDPPSEVTDRGLCQTGSVGGMGGNKAETAVRSHENIFFFLVWGDLHLQYLYNDREEGGWREQMPTAKERPSKRGVGGETVGTIPGKEKRFGRGGVAEVMEKKSSLQSASRERMIQASPRRPVDNHGAGEPGWSENLGVTHLGVKTACVMNLNEIAEGRNTGKSRYLNILPRG